MRVKPILGVFAVASGTIFLTACDEKGQQSFSNVLAAIGASDPVGEQQRAAFVIEEEPAKPAEPCVILPTEFRQWMCSEDGRKILIP